MSLYVPSVAEALEMKRSRGKASMAPYLWDNAVGLWPFLQGGGSELFDLSGFGNDGTLTAMAPADDWVTTGQRGIPWALDFDSTNDMVIGDQSHLSAPNTIATLLRTPGSGTARPMMIADLSHVSSYYALDINVGNDWSYWFRDATDFRVETGGNPLPDTWYSMAGITRSATQHELFVDGNSIGTSTSNSLPSNIDSFSFGALNYADANIYTECRVAFCGSWSRALPPSEIQQLHADPMAMFRRRPVILPVTVAAVGAGGSPLQLKSPLIGSVA